MRSATTPLMGAFSYVIATPAKASFAVALRIAETRHFAVRADPCMKDVGIARA